MQEIEVGEYVRTENGTIFIYTKEFAKDLQAQDFRLCNNGKIVKHSKNILSLIEVGDYVNRSKVVGYRIDRDDNNKRFGVLVEMENSFDSGTIDEEDIKTIVTKEQMASIEYKI